jgi:hypothetical protein
MPAPAERDPVPDLQSERCLEMAVVTERLVFALAVAAEAVVGRVRLEDLERRMVDRLAIAPGANSAPEAAVSTSGAM